MNAQPVFTQPQTGSKPFYSISTEDSQRIQLWRLWMVFYMPLRHVYTTANRIGGASKAAFFEPEWLHFIQHILNEIMARFVPSAFALIAAVLLFRKPFKWSSNVKRKFKSLLLPLILLTGFWVVVYAVAPHIPGIGSLFSSEGSRVSEWTAKKWFATFFGWTKEDPLPNILYPLWFLRDLMLMNLIAPAIKWMIDRFPRLCLATLAVMLLWKTESRFYFHTVHQVFIFFCLGYYVVKYDLHFSDLDRIPGYLIAGGYILSIAGAYLLQDYADVYSGIRGIPNLMGVLFYARFVSRFPGSPRWRKPLLWLAEYNVAIFLFHERMLTFVKRLSLRLLPECLGTSLFMFYVIPIIISAVCVFIGWFLRKYQPRLYRLITGSH